MTFSWINILGITHVLAQYTKIELFLFFVAFVTIFYLVLNFFTSLNEKHTPPHTDAKLSYDDMAHFERSIAYTVNSSVMPTGDIKILTNGKEFLPDFLSEIDRATNYIYVANYLWEDDFFGNAVFDALIKKAKRGVCVRVLLDGVGGRKASEKRIKALWNAGGRVVYFRPLRWWNLNRWDRRTHMRNIVVDGRSGYLGGIAFTKLWAGDATRPTSWHDYMFKVEGSFAQKLEYVFHNIWSQTTGEILSAPAPLPPKDDSAEKDHFVALFSSPAPDTSSNMEHFIWMSIHAAKKSIHIENPYLLPSKSIQTALMQKAEEGLDVRIIGPDGTDAKHVKWASQSYYTRLLNAGIKLYEYEPSMIHAKIMVIDGVWSIIGSANLDNRSSRINLELIAGTDSQKLARTLTEKFMHDMSISKEVTKKSWENHSILFSPVRLLARLFVRQY